MTRQQYAEIYGPTTGDGIRLGDTNLVAKIEKDYTVCGEEVNFGGGKVIRPGSIGAEDVMHDMGVISITSSDSQAMGRVGEVARRTWQVAHRMKVQRGYLDSDGEGFDNTRIKRYISKYTINPAVAHGISHEVGSIEEGKVADMVLWDPAFFGAKPEIVFKSGYVVMSVMGDSNASIPTPQPRTHRLSYAAQGSLAREASVTFMPTVAIDDGVAEKLGLTRRILESKNNRSISKADLPYNESAPKVDVDPQTYEVKIDGEVVTSEPAETLPLAQRYFIF